MPKSYFLIIVCIAITLVNVFFFGLKPDEFIFTSDEYISPSKEYSLNSFFIQQPNDFGSAYSTLILVTIFDRLFYLFGYLFNFSLHQIQVILYFFKIVISLSLSFIGFRLLFSYFYKKKEDIIPFLIAIWYCFNSFALVYWHGNAFSLTALITYSITPLSFYLFIKSIEPNSPTIYKIEFVITLFLISLTVYFLGVYILILLPLTLSYLIFNKKRWIHILKNLAIILALYLPFFLINFFYFFDIIFNPIQSLNMSGGGTYGSLNGGLLSPLFMWFSWAIYTIWEPRNIYTFYNYFYSIIYLITPFLLYGLIFYNVKKNIKKTFFLTLIITFSLLLFIIKGPQEPFGSVYLYLIDNFAFFRIFRSPDSKIGFGLVFLTATLLLYNYPSVRKKIFVSILLFVIVVQGFLIFNGTAIKGENKKNSSDRIISIPDDYNKVADVLNNAKTYGYVLMTPSYEYARYRLSENEIHLGQDLLSKIVNKPFSYISESGGITVQTYEKIISALETESLVALNQFPVHFFLVRQDIMQQKNLHIINNIKKDWTPLLNSRVFDLYENPNKLPLISGHNVTFNMINSTTYEITIRDIKDPINLSFYQSFNQNWHIYEGKYSNCNNYYKYPNVSVTECSDTTIKPYILESISRLTQKPVFKETHTMKNDYANQWSISVDDIKKEVSEDNYKLNPDSSIDVNLTLFYRPQGYFYVAIIIGSFYLIMLIFSIMYFKIKYEN